MNKVLIWDYTGISAQWMEQVADMKDIEIVGTITPKESVPEILLKRDAWDWLLIFEQGARNFFDATIQVLRLPLDRVIYALDTNSWVQRPKAAFSLIDMQRGGDILLNLNFAISRQLNEYLTCTVEGLNYIATAPDVILRDMYTRRVNWAANSMKSFHKLAKKYYDVDDSAGYFLDLGANIGTTGIYFTTKLAPNLKLISFEPDPETFKMHRINLLLNDLEDDKATVVNCGLGDKADEMSLYRNLKDPGANSVVQYKNNMPSKTIKIIPIDTYLAENKIAAQDVKYIWIDTEGFEPQVLLGAKNLLRENPAPAFIEYNILTWHKSGRIEDMMALLTEYYSHFVLFDGKETLHPLADLPKLEPWPGSWTRGDIFLIRKGAIV